jgi:hypothetical protein
MQALQQMQDLTIEMDHKEQANAAEGLVDIDLTVGKQTQTTGVHGWPSNPVVGRELLPIGKLPPMITLPGEQMLTRAQHMAWEVHAAEACKAEHQHLE